MISLYLWLHYRQGRTQLKERETRSPSVDNSLYLPTPSSSTKRVCVLQLLGSFHTGVFCLLSLLWPGKNESLVFCEHMWPFPGFQHNLLVCAIPNVCVKTRNSACAFLGRLRPKIYRRARKTPKTNTRNGLICFVYVWLPSLQHSMFALTHNS